MELAGAIAEIARAALARDFRRIDPKEAQIVLIEAGPRLLQASPRLSVIAADALRRLGVDILLGRAVTQCDAKAR